MEGSFVFRAVELVWLAFFQNPSAPMVVFFAR